MPFTTLCLFEYNTHDRRGVHEVQAAWRNDLLVSRVSNRFSTPSLEVSSGTGIGKDVGASTAPDVFGKRNRMTNLIDVDREKPVETCKSSRKLASRLERPTRWERYLPRLKTKRSATAASNDKAQEDMNGKEQGGAGTVKRTVTPSQGNRLLENYAGRVFDDPYNRDPRPGYSESREFVKDVMHDWFLNFVLPLGIGNKGVDQLYKINYPFSQAACTDHHHQAAVFFQ